jgi:hypothetical protein
MRPIRTVVQTLAVALAACLVAAGSAGAEMWTLTPNLVQNPGAELGSSGQGGAVGSIPSWWHGPLPAAVVHYGTPGFPTVAQAPRSAAARRSSPADRRMATTTTPFPSLT